MFSVKRLFDSVSRNLKQRLERRSASPGASFDKKLVLRFADKRLPTRRQLKHLPRFLTPKEKTAIVILTALAALGLLAAGVKFCRDHVRLEPAPGGDYVEAAIGGPRLINPLLASGNDIDADIAGLVFSGLMKTDAEGRLVPDLAESYEISPDGKTYTFHLKADVVWQDGDDFSANDVTATVNHIKDPAWSSPHFSQFKNVGVEAPDDRTVKFTLSEPFAPFLSLLTIGILPEHLWQEIAPENAARAELNLKPVGTGPFKFKSLVKDTKGAIHSYTLVANGDYYGAKPLLATLTFKFFPDLGSAVEALLQNKVEGIGFLPPEAQVEAAKMRTLKIYRPRLPQYTAVFFNQNKNALLKSRAVRQALALATDRERLLRETAAQGSTPAYGPILPGFVGFNPDVKKYAFDPQAAAALLEGEGWKIDEGTGVRQKNLTGTDGKPAPVQLALTLTTVDAQENIAIAQILKQNWTGIGVKTELEIVPASKIQQDKIRTRDYDALLYGEIIGPDPDPYPFWHSSQNAGSGLNLAVFANRRVDELLEKARQANQDDERAAYYKEFQDILAEETPAVFLYSPTYAYAVNRAVKGIEAGTIFTPADRFANINAWYVNTKRVWK